MSNSEQIRNTIEVFNPDKRGFVIGTAAVSFALGVRGGRLPYKVPDIDVIAPPNHIETLSILYGQQEGFSVDSTGGDVYTDDTANPQVSITPPANSGLLPYFAATRLADEKHTLHYIDRAKMPKTPERVAYLPLVEVLLHKLAIGREKDIVFVHEVISSEVLTADEKAVVTTALNARLRG